MVIESGLNISPKYHYKIGYNPYVTWKYPVKCDRLIFINMFV